MDEIKWPVDKCESCGYDLREATVKAAEKSNDSNGKLKWTGFCPKCGHGMFVGDRELPKPTEEEIAARESQAILKDKETSTGLEKFDPEHQVTTGEQPIGEVPNIPPDESGAALAEGNPDPEGLLGEKTEKPSEGDPEPGAIRPPGKGEFFCTKCATNHRENSKVGNSHSKKYREA